MKLWIRAEVSAAMGLGHLMRTTAIAEVARSRGLEVTFVLDADPQFTEIPARRRFDVYTPSAGSQPSWFERIEPGDVVLFDSYRFGAHDYRAASAAGGRVAAIDDLGTGEFMVDVLVNPNSAARVNYRTHGRTSILLGPEFAPVRKEFVDRRRPRGGGTEVLLVVPGGSDARGIAPRLLELLADNRVFKRAILIAGRGSRPVDDGPWKGWLTVHRDPPDVAAVFDQGDAAVAAAGVTTWELLAMGMPTALVKVADNQRDVIAVADRGAALSLGEATDVALRLPGILSRLAEPQTQLALSRRALEIVDGRGAERIVASLVGDRETKASSR